jgi:hypothetical protein
LPLRKQAKGTHNFFSIDRALGLGLGQIRPSLVDQVDGSGFLLGSRRIRAARHRACVRWRGRHRRLLAQAGHKEQAHKTKWEDASCLSLQGDLRLHRAH